MEQHVINHKLLLVIMPVQLINKKQLHFQIHGIIERILYVHLDTEQYQLNVLDNSLVHPVNHNHILEAYMTLKI